MCTGRFSTGDPANRDELFGKACLAPIRDRAVLRGALADSQALSLFILAKP